MIPEELHFFHLVVDAIVFVQRFSTVITENPLHIYASALPFTLTDSILHKTYVPLYPDIPHVVVGLHSHWPLVASFFGGLNKSPIRTTTFSPDGSQIVIGSDNGTLRLLNIKSGTSFNFEGHNGVVSSSRFLSDGSTIVTCSHDGRVCIWDSTTTRTSTIREFSSKTPGESLLCMTISPDDRLLACGSHTGFIYVWDPTGKSIIGQTLIKHTNCITSLVFLDDAPQMLSCSRDGMVCVWDTQMWQCICQPMVRHLFGVKSTMLSPCGSRLAVLFADFSIKFEDVIVDNLKEAKKAKSGSVTIKEDYLGVRVVYSDYGLPQLYDRSSGRTSSADAMAEVVITFAVFGGRQLAARHDDRNICIYDLSASTFTYRIVTSGMGNEGPVALGGLGYSQLAFCSADGMMHIWKI